MNFEHDFSRALRETEIHRERRYRLLTVGTTELPYVLLNRSIVNEGDTVVRRGVLRIEEPSIMLLGRAHQFRGFDDTDGDPEAALIAIGRLAHFPPARYTNQDMQMSVMEGSVNSVMRQMTETLDQREDEVTGVLSGPVELWQMSLLVYAGRIVRQSATGDVRELMRRFHHPN